MTDTPRLPNPHELAIAVISRRVVSTIITAEDVMSDDDPAIEALTDDEYWTLATEVDRLASIAIVSIAFPIVTPEAP